MMRRTSFWGVLEGLVGLHSESESDVAQSCLTLCDPMDCSLPGSSLHGILQVGLRAAAAAAKSLLSCDPIDGSPPGFLSLGFSRQEHWSVLPFPSPMHESEK